MYFVPVIFSEVNKSWRFYEGLIYKLPVELGGSGKLNRYSTFTTGGWFEVDYGTSCYSYVREDGSCMIFLGIRNGEEKNKLQCSPVIETSKEQFENYVFGIISRENSFVESAEKNIDLITHDLRRISAAIYYAAEELKTHLESEEYALAEERVRNIIAAQSMLRIRVDMIDYSSSPGEFNESEHIPFYRRVDKVIRCFTPIASKSNISFKKTGNSHSEIYGPSIFEIVPYTIIENAVKYSPEYSSIDIDFGESATHAWFSISSIGPEIQSQEQPKIFERGVRGEAAETLVGSSSGLGLFLAKSLIEQFKGTIEVCMDPTAISTSSGEMYSITFTVNIPISRKHTAPTFKSKRRRSGWGKRFRGNTKNKE